MNLPSGGTWQYRTDNMGRLLAIRRPGAAVEDVTLAYDSTGRVESMEGANGRWNYAYADSGDMRTTTVSGPLGVTRATTVDLASARVRNQTDMSGASRQFSYDGAGRPVRI